MSLFTDLFVIQIIGLLRNRKFSGSCHFDFGSSLAHLHFSDGLLMNVSHGNLEKSDALNKILWNCSGEIVLVPQVQATNGWDFNKALSQSILKFSPPMPESCPFMKNIILERSKIAIDDEATFATVAQTIYNNVRSSGADLPQAKGELPAPDFWKGFFYLSGSGKILSDYSKSLSVLLLKIQGNVITNLQKTLGKKAANLYQDRLSQNMDDLWPNTPKHKNYDRIYGAYDRIYGTAPYRTWAKLLSETTTKVASGALGSSCYKKAIASLQPIEKEILNYLIN